MSKKNNSAVLESEISKIVKVKPISVWKRGMNANVVKVLPNARITLAPFEDHWGNLVTGHTVEECKSYSFATVDKEFWKNFKVALSDTELTLDISKEQDYLVYKFLKVCQPIIANSRDEVTGGTKYIMFNEEEIARTNNIKKEKLMKAMSYLNDMSQVDRAKFLRLYGYRTKSVSSEVILNHLYSEAEKDPSRFIEIYEDKLKNDRILIESLVQNEILTKKGPSYYYGTDIIGANLDLTIAYFNEPSNQSLKIDLMKLLELKESK